MQGLVTLLKVIILLLILNLSGSLTQRSIKLNNLLLNLGYTEDGYERHFQVSDIYLYAIYRT